MKRHKDGEKTTHMISDVRVWTVMTGKRRGCREKTGMFYRREEMERNGWEDQEAERLKK